MTAQACRRCRTTRAEVHGGLCQRCFFHLRPADDLGAIGRRLGIKPCRECGEPLGARYRARDGRMLCWPCAGYRLKDSPRPADPDWQQFRCKIIDRLVKLDREGFHYINADTVVGTCPVCREPSGYLAVHFHGRTPRADLVCSLGCDEHDIARRLAR